MLCMTQLEKANSVAVTAMQCCRLEMNQRILQKSIVGVAEGLRKISTEIISTGLYL